MFKKLLNLVFKKRLVHQHAVSHASVEHVLINEDGSTVTFLIGACSYGKNSSIPAHQRKPVTTIEHKKS